MTDNYQELVNLLGKNLKFTGTEIVETLWLATKINYPDAEKHNKKAANSEEKKTGSQVKTDDKKLPDLPSINKKEQFDNKQPKKKSNSEVGITSKFKKSSDKSLEIAAPDGSSLSDHLGIAKSLRPLRQYVACGRATVLDEEATIEKIAELEGIFFPVLKPPLELQFDLELVVDMSSSMIFWQRTIRELKKLLKRYGIFRNFQSWGLLTDEQGNILLRKGFDYRQKNKKLYSPQRLTDPSGRRLILVVSDCVSPMWRNGLAFKQLAAWGKHNVVAIAQILPERMWSRTALSLGSMAQLDCAQPHAPNRNLKIKELFVWNDENLSDALKVPVFSLDPELIQTWSEMIVKQGGIGAEGFVFSNFSQPKSSSLPTAKANSELSSEDRFYNFEMSSSLKAMNLAKLLAASPVINLPFVRLLQTNYGFEQHHVAEVFLGNILKPLTPITPDINPDEVEYRFHDEAIRQHFIDSSSRRNSQEIIIRISRYFADRFGISLKSFYALLQNPDELNKLKEEQKVDNFDVDYFARVTTKVLKRLGGAYARLARDIEQGLPPDEPSPPTPPVKPQNLIPLTRKVALRSPDETLSSEILARYDRVLKAVNDGLNQNSWVEVVDEEEQFDFQLRINEQGQFEIADAKAKGEVFTNIRPVLAAEVNHSERTAKRLVHMAQFNIIEQLDNPDSNLAEHIEFELCDRDKNPYSNPENINVELEEITYLRIKNNSSKILYFTVLDLEPTWEISVIPFEGNYSSLSFSLEAEEESYKPLRFVLPQDKLYDLATETLKLFVYNDERLPFELLSLPSLDRDLDNETRIIPEVSQRLARLDSQAREFLQLNSLGKLLTNISDDLDNPERKTRGDSYDLKSQSDVDWASKIIKIRRFYPESREIIINNTFTPAEPDQGGRRPRWDWKVYLDNAPQLLDEIDYVEYTLDKTFEDPIRTIRDPQNNFALESNGWAEFEVLIRVFFKDGGIKELSHWLYLGITIGKVLILVADSVDENIEPLIDKIDKEGDRYKFLLKYIVLDSYNEIQKDITDFVINDPQDIPIIIHYFGFEIHQEEFYSLESLNQLFSLLESRISCVLINGVYNQNQIETINKYVDYVIGIERQNIDEEVIAFWKGFYGALGNGRNIKDSFTFGKNTIFIEVAKLVEGLSPPPVTLRPILYIKDSPGFEFLPLEITTAKISFAEDTVLKFETITVDSAGQTINEENHQNTYFEQELGEDSPSLIMMAIPEGEFMMGSPEDELQRYDDESPQHQVKVSPFWLAQTPVTNAQWNFVVNLPQEQIELKSKEAEEKADHPVVEVNWYQAMEFCARLSHHTGRNYRLPSEAEWEYACRANTTTPFHFGKTITGKLANYDASKTYAQEPAEERRNTTLPVKSFTPNAFGLYDMHGNVLEWCADPWHEDYKDAPQNRDSSVWDEQKNYDNRYHNILANLKELLNDQRSRVLRGGSFGNYPRLCRSAYRGRSLPDDVYGNFGFRLAVSDPRTT